MLEQSESIWQRAKQVMPGGVNSPVRSFSGVGGGVPPCIQSAKGAYLVDADKNHYVDYVCSWGTSILGHADPSIESAVIEQLRKGTSYGASTELEVELAEEICKIMPSMERVRMVNSGTEAVMTAIRLARGFTGRKKVLKFTGCYHGHVDYLLVEAGSGVATLGIPGSPGVPEDFTAHTLTAEYNRLDQVEACFEAYGDDIAAVIVEPMAGNMNFVLPQPGFLEGLRAICSQYESVLIFDEVMTGFRVALTGVQGLYDITPDLTTFGKIIAGGLPVGAFGGRADIMACLAPEGGVYQAGTLSGNPLAMAAGLVALKAIQAPGFHEKLGEVSGDLADSLQALASQQGIPLQVRHVGGMWGFFFTDLEAITCYADVKACDRARFNQFFRLMLQQGVYFAPSPFEANFISAAHSSVELSHTLQAAESTFKQLK